MKQKKISYTLNVSGANPLTYTSTVKKFIVRLASEKGLRIVHYSKRGNDVILQAI